MAKCKALMGVIVKGLIQLPAAECIGNVGRNLKMLTVVL